MKDFISIKSVDSNDVTRTDPDSLPILDSVIHIGVILIVQTNMLSIFTE